MVIGARGAVCLGKVVPGLLDLEVDLVVLHSPPCCFFLGVDVGVGVEVGLSGSFVLRASGLGSSLISPEGLFLWLLVACAGAVLIA